MFVNNYNEEVIILMSTYNGETYLKDQVESLLRQDYPNTRILIRDDGSVDRTLEILKFLEEQHEIISVIYGENIGVVNSFFELLKVSYDSKYYAFCDQDDIWLSDKVSKAINMINKIDSQKAILYGSNLTVVDQDLKVIRNDSNLDISPSFNNSLLQNVMTGCTIVINNIARKYLLKQIPSNLRMHDWWMYQVISGIGEVIYDHDSKILYRQHANNTVGSYQNKMHLWVKRIKRFKNKSSLPFIMHHAREIDRIFKNDLSIENQKVLDNFLTIEDGLIERIMFVVKSNASRQNLIDNILFKALILFKKI